jgi:carboxymethylenebutenolidase
MGELITFRSNGVQASGYLALPKSGSGPGVLVIQEWWGLVGHITNVCDRFAAENFVALAPDLYHGKKTDEPNEAEKLAMALRLPDAAKDLAGAIDALKDRSEGSGVGVVGFCLGGGLALFAASQRPNDVRAVVPFYGYINSDDASAQYAAITGAVQGHFAENDTWATPEIAREIERQIRASGNTDVTMHVYPNAEHAFFNDERPESYSAEASALAWERTLAFLRKELG